MARYLDLKIANAQGPNRQRPELLPPHKMPATTLPKDVAADLNNWQYSGPVLDTIYAPKDPTDKNSAHIRHRGLVALMVHKIDNGGAFAEMDMPVSVATLIKYNHPAAHNIGAALTRYHDDSVYKAQQAANPAAAPPQEQGNTTMTASNSGRPGSSKLNSYTN